jgi:HicB family
MVRMPGELHNTLSVQAHEQRVPLNQPVVALQSAGIGWQTATGEPPARNTA